MASEGPRPRGNGNEGPPEDLGFFDRITQFIHEAGGGTGPAPRWTVRSGTVQKLMDRGTGGAPPGIKKATDTINSIKPKTRKKP